MSDQNTRPLTRGEQLSILHHAMVTWRELKLNAFLKTIRQAAEEGRQRNAESLEQSLAFEKELHTKITRDILPEFFDNSAKLEELRELIAAQELPDGCSFVEFFKPIDEYLTKAMNDVFTPDNNEN